MIKDSMLFMHFNGRCENALDVYQTVFGADIIEKVTYGEAEISDKEHEKSLIMNSTFKIGGMTYCANDVLDNSPIVGNQLSIWLEFDGEASLNDAYKRFQQNDCKILSELEETFWNSLYTKVQDPFGVTWELNYQK